MIWGPAVEDEMLVQRIFKIIHHSVSNQLWIVIS